MTWVFRTKLGTWVFVYIDDIFVFTDSFEEHEEALEYVLTCLLRERLFISDVKFFPYAERIDCLGYIIDDQGIHLDTDKLEKIRVWPVPTNFNEVLRFLGLVEYLSRFLPNISAWTSPLSSMCTGDRAFVWRALYQKCFDEIKRIVCADLVLKPINRHTDEPIWVVSDACPAGCGAYYGQGSSWETMQPAGFMSKKFTSAQRNYFTYEHETLGVLEALLKWEDKLIGLSINIVTDHKALQTFRTKAHAGPRQIRWSGYLERFRYTLHYVPGKSNKVADAFSRLYESTLRANEADYVQADVRLDPDGDELTTERLEESKRRLMAMRRRAPAQGEITPPASAEIVETTDEPRLQERVEPRDIEARELHNVAHTPSIPDTDLHDTIVEQQVSFFDTVAKNYGNDTFFAKVKSTPERYRNFSVNDGLIVTENAQGHQVTCIPLGIFKGRRLTEIIVDQAHRILGHLGAQKTNEYVRRWFWWPKIGKYIDSFCESCDICQATKTVNQKPQGFLHSMPIPDRPWASIAMDFVGPFPLSNNFDYVWVILDRFTSLVHLVPTTTTVTASKLATLFIEHIVRLHGLPDSIVSDRDTKFTAEFWAETHRLLGVQLLKSTAFHPQTDGASERMIRVVSGMLRTLVKPDQTNWSEKLPLVEFACNSSTNESSGFAPFELTYGFIPRMIQTVEAAKYPGVQAFAQNAVNNFTQARDALIESRVRQTTQSNRHRRADPAYKRGQKVYLSTVNLNLPKGRARKLAPKFIGPYEIIRAHPETSSYTLELPEELMKRRIHPTFHSSLLKSYSANDADLFPNRPLNFYYDFGHDEDHEYLVTEIRSHKWRRNHLWFEVLWDTGEITLEPHKNCEDLVVLDQYLELQGVATPEQLPRSRAVTVVA
jgi:hypothetical protein